MKKLLYVLSLLIIASMVLTASAVVLPPNRLLIRILCPAMKPCISMVSIARLLPAPPARYEAGEILLEARDVLRMSPVALRRIRGRVVSYVFQDPGASLNPVLRVGTQIRESLKLHRPGAATEEEVVRLLRQVGIPAAESRRRDYPHQLSGGMQQRVMMAIAVASHPRLLIADEPTTALDVTIQAQILDLLRDLQRRLGMAILLITHNLGIVGEMAGRVAVMYAGEIIEVASAPDLLRQPLHPYTRALLESVPRLLSGDGATRLDVIAGTVPLLGQMPPGCRFAPRCPYRRPECVQARPAMRDLGGGRFVRCPYAESFPCRA